MRDSLGMDFVAIYNHTATELVWFLQMPRSLLHLHIGMAIYLGCQFLMGTRRGSLAAVFVTVMLALFHEVMNRIFHGSWRLADTSEDLVLTLFWPTMCYGVSSFRRWQWAQRERFGARMWSDRDADGRRVAAIG